jgi:hypothetical protein
MAQGTVRFQPVSLFARASFVVNQHFYDEDDAIEVLDEYLPRDRTDDVVEGLHVDANYAREFRLLLLELISREGLAEGSWYTYKLYVAYRYRDYSFCLRHGLLIGFYVSWTTEADFGELTHFNYDL